MYSATEARREIQSAVGLSVVATVCFVSLLAPVFLLQELVVDSSPCSISGCELFNGGRSAAVTYWTHQGRLNQHPEYFMATLDLQGEHLVVSGDRPNPNDWMATTVFPGRQLLGIDSQGRITRIPLVRHNTSDNFPALFGGRAPVQLQSVNDRLVAALAGENLLVCDLEREKLLWTYTESRVTCFVVVPTRRAVVTLLADGRILELDARTGRPLREATQLPAPGYTAAISCNGRRLAVSHSNYIRILELPSETGPWTDVHAGNRDIPGYGRILGLSPSGGVMVTAPDRYSTSKLALWCLSTGRCLQQLDSGGKPFQGAAFSNEHTLISWSYGGTLTRWDFRRGTRDEWQPQRKQERFRPLSYLFAHVL